MTRGKPAQRGVVDRRGAPVEIERGHVPRTAHDRDGFVPVLERAPDRSPHVGLATLLPSRRHRARPCGDHRLGDRVERGRAVATVFDHVLPPPLRVGIAGGRSQLAQRVGRRRVGDEFVGRPRRRT